MRTFLTIALPLLLPTVLYVLWLTATGRRPPDWGGTAWPWVMAAGVMLMLATLGLWGLGERNAPGGVYVPPVVKDGAVVPGHIERP